MKFVRYSLLVLCMALGMVAAKGHAEKSPRIEPVQKEQGNSDFSIDNLLKDRAMGDPNAPIEIIEFSSLSCPHCKVFHDNVLDKLKETYIDTGKVKLTFSDFPLNKAALQASMIARCMPEPLYFQYIAFLFETQADWAFSGDSLPLPEAKR